MAFVFDAWIDCSGSGYADGSRRRPLILIIDRRSDIAARTIAFSRHRMFDPPHCFSKARQETLYACPHLPVCRSANNLQKVLRPQAISSPPQTLCGHGDRDIDRNINADIRNHDGEGQRRSGAAIQSILLLLAPSTVIRPSPHPLRDATGRCDPPRRPKSHNRKNS